MTDVYYTFFVPVLAVLGFLFNMLTFLILSGKQFRNNFYISMRMITLSDSLFMFLCIFLVIIRCGRFCPYSYRFEAKIYELYIYLFIGNSLNTFVTLNYISISINRLVSFRIKKNFKVYPGFRILIPLMIIISLFMNSIIYILCRSVRLTENLKISGSNSTFSMREVDFFRVETNHMGNNQIVNVLVTILVFFKGLILSTVLLFINILIVYKYKSHISNNKLIIKYQSSNQKKILSKEQRVTSMILWTNSFYLVGNVPSCFAPIIFRMCSNHIYENFLLFTNTFLFMFHASNFFLIFASNSSFRKTFKSVRKFNFNYFDKIIS
jgi:hypothetical protein